MVRPHAAGCGRRYRRPGLSVAPVRAGTGKTGAQYADLVDTIGLDKFLEMASVPIGALEDLLGKTRAAALITEARTGSRRIKAVPKRAAGEK